MQTSGQHVRNGLFILVLALVLIGAPLRSLAAPYAAMVVDARSGEVLHSRNADARLHPASLTKMMTLYIAFEAIENGEISLDKMVKISKNAASEPPSKWGLQPGQRIALRHLIRAAAVKSANDAATAIGEAIEGSEAAFARRMNRTAKALGMSRTTFKNANGLTEEGHLSTARDMTTLGRHLFYDYPAYYNLFSRIATNAGGKEVYNTNRRFLSNYKGADGIKTGYTRAAGFNLVASAERGNERIIATVFGGRSTATRNAEVAKLLDMGFRRAPTRVAVYKPARPPYMGHVGGGTMIASNDSGGSSLPAGKTIRLVTAVSASPRPKSRPGQTLPTAAETVMIALQDDILNAVKEANTSPAVPVVTAGADTLKPLPKPETLVAEAAPQEQTQAEEAPRIVATAEPAPAPAAPAAQVATAGQVVPKPRPLHVILASLSPVEAPAGPEVVTRMSTSGGRHWGINVGRYGSRYEAERVLLKAALAELGSLDNALRKVSQSNRGFEANFVGMTEEQAALACRRLQAHGSPCATIGPSS